MEIKNAIDLPYCSTPPPPLASSSLLLLRLCPGTHRRAGCRWLESPGIWQPAGDATRLGPLRHLSLAAVPPRPELRVVNPSWPRKAKVLSLFPKALSPHPQPTGAFCTASPCGGQQDGVPSAGGFLPSSCCTTGKNEISSIYYYYYYCRA